MPEPNQAGQVRRQARLPEAAGRVLETASRDGQRAVTMTSWLLNALRLVNNILGATVRRNERRVPDPTESVLGDPDDRVRVPNL